MAALVIAAWVGREGIVALRYALSEKFAGGCGCGKAGVATAQARLLAQITQSGTEIVERP
eukprot:SAG31_NODE_24433_length_481_cov_0.979058_1_plen_60_part_00